MASDDAARLFWQAWAMVAMWPRVLAWSAASSVASSSVFTDQQQRGQTDKEHGCGDS
jgi:hypothetical protein